MVENNFNIKQKVSGFLALTFIMLLSLALGWYSIKTSEEVLVNMPNSEVINISRRIPDKNSAAGIDIQNLLKENGIGSNEDTSNK